MQIAGSIILIVLICILLWRAYGDLQEKLRRRKINKESGGKIVGNIGNHPRGIRETTDEKDKGKIIDIRRRKAQ